MNIDGKPQKDVVEVSWHSWPDKPTEIYLNGRYAYSISISADGEEIVTEKADWFRSQYPH